MKNKTTIPTTITVTFIEKDRQEASYYGSSENCILATALKRRGFQVAFVGPYVAELISKEVRILFKICGEDGFYPEEHFPEEEVAPFYTKSIVGTKVKLRKAND